MIEVRYLPALLSNLTRMYVKNTDAEFAERFQNIVPNPRFFNEGAVPFVPHFLLSAPTTRPDFRPKANPNGHDNLYDLLGIDRTTDVFIDSGGFSLMTGALKEKDWTNKDAFDFSIKNGTVFPILDRPVIPGCDFDLNLKLSLESAQYYYDRKDEAKDKLILNVVHGNNLEEIKRWTDTISQVQLDGWALGSSFHGGDTKEIILSLLYLLEAGHLEKCKYLHIFGVSGAENVLYFNALKHLFAKHFPEIDMIISYDSTSPFMSFLNSVLYYSYSVDKIHKVKISSRYDWSKFAGEGGKLHLPCDCVHCDAVDDIEAMMKDPTEYYMWGYMHNLKIQMDYIENNAKILDMCYAVGDELFDSMLNKKAVQNLKVLDEAFGDIKNSEEIIRKRFQGKHKKFKSDYNNLDKFMV